MMGITALIIFILALPVVTLSCTNKRLIYVDSQTGINDSSCWEGGYSTPCLSLNIALEGAQHYNHSTTIFLQPGQHQLHSGSETQLRNMSQLAIVGNNSEGEVVVTCQPLAGLAFFGCTEIEIKNMKIVSCGALHNSTSQFVTGYSSAFLEIQVAVFFSSGKIIQLKNLGVITSNGTGVVLYNSVGVVHLDMCQFVNNGLSGKQAVLHAGGGGLVMEANGLISSSFCTITNSTFTSNTASSGQFSFLSPTINPSGYFGLGRGGGISVVFRGGAANNTLQLVGVQIEHNMAQFGSGMFLAFYDNTNNNHVIIVNNKVTKNNGLTVTDTSTTSGGGFFICFVAVNAVNPFNNNINISSCKFTLNKAQKGGGITVNALHSATYSSTSNKLLIENCTFDSNTALDGSSVIISQSKKSSQSLLHAIFCSSNFTNAQCGYRYQYFMYCSSSVLIESLPITFKGTLQFSENRLSALGLRFSSVELLPTTQLQFTNNTAINGAALHIVNCSSVVVNNGTSLFFKNNTASHQGGAIYSETCALDKAIDKDCIIRHSNSAIHPDNWNTSFTFINNQEQTKYRGIYNSININSIQSCIWPDSEHKTFCWNGWVFLDDSGVADHCFNQLRSGPDNYINKNGLTKYTVYPGECINLLQIITIYDVWGHDITNQTSLQVDVLFGVTGIVIIDNIECQCNFPTLSDECLPPRLCEHYEVALKTDCNEGYANHSSQILVHPPQFPGIVLDIAFKLCNNKSTCEQRNGMCIANDYHYGSKPQFCYIAVCDRKNFLPYITSTCVLYFDINCFKQLAYDLHSTTCGSCSDPDYGIAINFPHLVCAKCEPFKVMFFICLEVVPVLIMMVILSVFHINIIKGNLNAFILYSQLVTLQFPGHGYTGWVPITQLIYFNYYFLGIPLTVYSIWNLNFLTLYRDPFCIPNIRTATGVILLQYVIAACPLLFIIVSYTWIHCYNNGYRLVGYTTRPIHRLLARFWQKFRIQPSLIDAYAGFLLLAYMRFLAVSVKLLQFIAIDAQSPFPLETMPVHATLGTIAVLCLIVFVLFPMAVLFLYHLKIFQRFLTWCRLDRPGLHALVDAYQGCFKNSATDGRERRYFAGIHLLFRFCSVVSFVFFQNSLLFRLHLNVLGTSEICLSVVMIGLVLILQPYKQTAYNVIEFLMIFFMAVIGGLSTSGLNIYVIIGPLFLPFLFLLTYFIYRVLKYCCCACVTWSIHRSSPDDENNPSPSEQQPILAPPTTTEVTLDDYVQDDLYADRILNPGQYDEQHDQY